ncbi:MAG: 1-acyl-sn-glycerol-3-phosphate acyltransferase [Micromonosporaceae bacterium]|nr:1-acyl-sn-glycerol-3-phosphate acyltransferase [Micromonosporaceae bacterium]
MTRRDWRGMENIPATGPVIIVANHMSHADPLVLAHFVYDAGRWPNFLAKSGLFRVPVLGWLLRAVDQTPVERGTVDAVKALDAAIAALRDGKCVLIYPEGTTTKEPDLWPMRGKTGVARLWLATGAPVVPVAMWGPQRIFDPRTRTLRLKPRTPVSVVAGPPLDLSAWQDAPVNTRTLAEITDHIMTTVRDMVAQLRGGTPPPLWQPGRRDAQAVSDPAMGDQAVSDQAVGDRTVGDQGAEEA